MARSHSSIARRANMSASNITRFFSNADFDVSGVRITTSAATDIRPPGPLALNQSVDVCGTLLTLVRRAGRFACSAWLRGLGSRI